MLRAARGRNVSISVPDCALPSEIKSRRGRTAKVPAADCALPGVEMSSSARGRVIIPDVPDVPAAPDVRDVPDILDVPDVPDVPDAAAVVLQVPDTQLGLQNLCYP